MSPLPLLLALQFAVLAGPPQGTATPAFPHDRHARLFPVCSGCHAGVQSDDPVRSYPAPDVCVRCHDGTRAPRVSWTGANPPPRNLAFSHGDHAEAAEADCAACHAAGPGRMAVAGPRPALCLRCHGGGGHLEVNDRCRRCHTPLARVGGWNAARIAALPQPPSHGEPGFLQRHGGEAGGASCAVCHARESCERCHLNGASLAPIAGLDRDARVAALLANRAPRYFRPATHGAEWEWRHGVDAARSIEACANCHAQETCRTCHVRLNAEVAALPEPLPDDTRGVRFTSAPHVHPTGFATRHGAAGANESLCSGCHDSAECMQCHAGSSDPEFHDRNFIARHGPESFGNEVQCSSCHNAELFCRSCHAGTGRSAAGRGEVVYHGGSALWLLGHGQAARQSLESCTSCHAQTDCARCHSKLGGWGVSPHGSGFPGARLLQQNRQMCLRCHSSVELTGP